MADPNTSELLRKHNPKKSHAKHELTSDHVQHLAGKGLHDPASLSQTEVRELCGSVLSHIAQHHESLAAALEEAKTMKPRFSTAQELFDALEKQGHD